MFTYQDRDIPKMPTPSKMHLPILQEAMLEEMNEDHFDPKQDLVDPMLLKLPAANLKGTFAKAYKILTEITNQIGWDTLLKCRSSVFVMEEEYREEKKNSSVATLRGTPRQSEDRASPNGTDEKPETNGEDSSEDESDISAAAIEKPESAVPVEPRTSDDGAPDDERSIAEKYTHFQNKRLCERWLDNLFMVLYEVSTPCRQRKEISADSILLGSSCVYHLAFGLRAKQVTIVAL